MDFSRSTATLIKKRTMLVKGMMTQLALILMILTEVAREERSF
jgi:hypothetical protein